MKTGVNLSEVVARRIAACEIQYEISDIRCTAGRDLTYDKLFRSDLSLIEPCLGDFVVDFSERFDQLSSLGLSSLNVVRGNVS
jgi:hypothetical protein